MRYESIQDILDSTEKDDIKRQLKELGVPYTNQGEAKLAKLLFEKISGGGEVVTEVVTESKPSGNKWEKMASSIESEVKKIKKDKQGNRPTTFIAKNFNFNLAPLDKKNKKNKRMRYVEGYTSLNEGEQKEEGDTYPVEYIKFKGLGGQRIMEMDGFRGRSILQTKDELLIEYITNHHSYGTMFVLYDETEKSKRELQVKRKIDMLSAAIWSADDNDLVATLSFLDMKKGSDTFGRLYNETNNNLVQNCFKYVNNDPDTFIEAMKSDVAKAVFLVNLAKAQGKITVTSDGREVKWANNNTTFCKSSLSTDWQTDCTDLLATAEGQKIFEKLEMMTGYHIV